MKKLFFIDFISFNLAFLISYWLRIHSGLFAFSDVSLQAYGSLLLFSNFFLFLVFASFNLYKEKRGSFTTDEFIATFKALLLVLVIVTATTFLYKATIYSRLILAFTFTISLFLVAGMRSLTRRLFSSLFQKKIPVVICKEDAIGKRLFTKIKEHPELGYHYISFINNLKAIDKLKTKPEIVFVTSKHTYNELTDTIMHHQDIAFKIVPDFLELIMGPLNFDEFKDIPLITFPKQSSVKNYLFVKRIIDVLVSSFLLLIFSPLFFVIAVLIKLTSKGPLVKKQLRVGKREKLFVFYKFRTMLEEADKRTNVANEVAYLYKRKYDPRITFFGKFLRRTCMDELPQLWNVLKGDMSLVGPRPHFKEELQVLQGWQKKRFTVKPGMTGIWQVSGRHELSFDKTVLLDIYYINHLSFFLDVQILLKTIPAIIFSAGRW